MTQFTEEDWGKKMKLNQPRMQNKAKFLAAGEARNTVF